MMAVKELEVSVSLSLAELYLSHLHLLHEHPTFETQGLGAAMSSLGPLPKYTAVQQIIHISKKQLWSFGPNKNKTPCVLLDFKNGFLGDLYYAIMKKNFAKKKKFQNILRSLGSMLFRVIVQANILTAQANRNDAHKMTVGGFKQAG